MPYKHPTDLLFWRKHWYRDHKQQMNERSASYYQEHKNDEKFKQTRAAYMRRWRARNKLR